MKKCNTCVFCNRKPQTDGHDADECTNKKSEMHGTWVAGNKACDYAVMKISSDMEE